MNSSFNTTRSILQAQRREILGLAVKHGACNVRVFGSVVRGEETADSDIDFLVDLGEKLSPWFPVGLIRDLEDLLDRKVDVVTEKSLHYYIRDKVLAEAQVL
ncbi:nucleotidyltransferase family protein [Oscillatoria sp. CS-180]|uniref:nucleotidyltransferase family protein n=1 Tax=Oscillatoria sp. CS-180 TaxID=3021720 RepID=UPI00232C4F39|nr:nucleotidyltransferase family protein [Oscillatoria sp. CS-180]MDB9528137.1 nucleotidyltransferase family protein [Oscillatoria sp. CS-180]